MSATVYLCMQCLSPSGKKWERKTPWARWSLLFFFLFFHFLLWHTILLCLTWSPFTVSLLFVSSGSGSYSNPFLHASDRQILSLLRCCSTWQGIRLGTPFAIQVIHNLCTFAHFFLNENPPQKTKQSWLLRCSFVALDLWRQIKYPSTCCQHSSAIRP